MRAKRALSIYMAFAVVLAAGVGAITLAQSATEPSSQVGDRADDSGDLLDAAEALASLSPIQEVRAVLPAFAVPIGVAMATGASGAFGVQALLGGSDPDAGAEEEALQVKIDKYQQAWQQKQKFRTVDAVFGNSVRNTDTKMRIETIEALNQSARNDLSITDAKTQVAQVANNRTSVKEINALNAWSATALTAQFIENTTDNQSDISDSFADVSYTVGQYCSSGSCSQDGGADLSIDSGINASEWTKNVTLQNGTTHQVTRIPIRVSEDTECTAGEQGDCHDESRMFWVGPNTDVEKTYTFQVLDESLDKYRDRVVDVTFEGYYVSRGDSEDWDTAVSGNTDVEIADHSRWERIYQSALDQNNEIVQSVHSLADNHYAEVKAGDKKLPTTNPYYVAETAAADGQEGSAFLASFLASNGISNPQDWQNVSRMKVTLGNGTVVYGQLLGEGLPQNITFNEGVQYNSSNFSGNPYMLTSQGKVPLPANWTLNNVTGLGVNKSSVTFESADLNASTLDGLREAVAWMQKQQAESEARENKKEDTAGGGGWLPDIGNIWPSIPSEQILIILGLFFAGLIAVNLTRS